MKELHDLRAAELAEFEALAAQTCGIPDLLRGREWKTGQAERVTFYLHDRVWKITPAKSTA